MRSHDLNRPRILMTLGTAFCAGFLFKNSMDYLDMGRTGFGLLGLCIAAAMAASTIIFGIIVTRAPSA